jgi:aminotransferase
MPRFPNLSRFIEPLPYFFAPFIDRADNEFANLHLGDTFHSLPEAANKIAITSFNKYDHLGGFHKLRNATFKRCNDLYNYQIGFENTFITAGCLGALNLSTSAILEPGDEIIGITPCWPNFGGVVLVRGGIFKQVPISMEAWPIDLDDFRDRLRKAITNKTIAIYFCDPNNPGGFVLPEEYIEAIEAIASENRLWIIHDISYADLNFSDKQMTHLLPRGIVSDQLFVTGSYSKSFSMAGHRIGYIIMPKNISNEILKVQTFLEFHPSNIAQLIALACIDAGNIVIEEAREVYRKGAELTKSELIANFHPSDAAAYVFIKLGNREGFFRDDTNEFLSRCIEMKVSLAPGAPFGDDFENYVRLCYTSEPIDKLKIAIEKLNLLFKTL